MHGENIKLISSSVNTSVDLSQNTSSFLPEINWFSRLHFPTAPRLLIVLLSSKIIALTLLPFSITGR